MAVVLLVNQTIGIKPILFHFGTFEVSSYSTFFVLGIIAASIVYYYEAKKANVINEHSFIIAIAAFIGSTIGAKLLELIINIDSIDSKNGLLLFLLSGRTVIGGLIGGTVSVWITKRIIGIKAKRGNLFAPAIALGIAIGRIGCFLNGCCYGKPSNVLWSVDFGDGIHRHPTQLYESIFMLSMFFVLKYAFNNQFVASGFLFKVLMICYFIFRFFIEFIRVEKLAFLGLSYFQYISFFVLIFLIFSEKRLFLNQIKDYEKARKK